MVGMIDPEVTLVSVHIPKTGGMTLLSILQQVYVGHLQLAYEESVMIAKNHSAIPDTSLPTSIAQCERYDVSARPPYGLAIHMGPCCNGSQERRCSAGPILPHTTTTASRNGSGVREPHGISLTSSDSQSTSTNRSNSLRKCLDGLMSNTHPERGDVRRSQFE